MKTLTINEMVNVLEELGIEYEVDNIVDTMYNSYGDIWNIEGYEYLILDEDEVDEALIENISETLWAFSSDFLSSITRLDVSIFEAIQSNGRCESNNEVIEALLKGTNVSMQNLVDEATMWDGRGHFLSSYDGEELEVSTDEGLLLLYRV